MGNMSDKVKSCLVCELSSMCTVEHSRRNVNLRPVTNSPTTYGNAVESIAKVIAANCCFYREYRP